MLGAGNMKVPLSRPF